MLRLGIGLRLRLGLGLRKMLKKTHKKTKQKQITKTKLSLQLFFMANFDRVNGPIDMRVWKGGRCENILKSGKTVKTVMPLT
jgi:hypothetical protein